MKRMTVIVASIILSFCAQGIVSAAHLSDFKFQTPIQREETHSVPVRLVLGYDIIINTSAGFSDVRIFDDTGVEVPYVIYAQSRPKETARYFSWEIVDYHYTDTTQTIVLKKPPHIDISHDLRISTNTRDFFRDVGIYESNDQKTWHMLMTGSFFDFSSQVNFRKNNVEIPEIEEPYLKIEITDPTRQNRGNESMRFQYKDLSFSINQTQKGEIKIDGFSSIIGKESKEISLYDEAAIQAPETVIDKDGNTLVKLGKLNVPAATILIRIGNPYFYRQVELWTAEKDSEELYHVTSRDVLYRIPDIRETKTQLPVHFNRPAYARLKIINKDNPPLIVENVTIRWVRRNLYFIPQKGRSYTLYFGGTNIKVPEYELKKIIANQYDKLIEYEEWAVGGIRENSSYSPKTDEELSQRIQKYLFIGLILLLVCGLGYWVFKLMGKMSESEEDTNR